MVRFGYVGQRTADVATGISLADVGWLCGYLGRISDPQLEAALLASGGDGEEVERFVRAIRNRIDQLIRAAGSGGPAATPS